MAKRYMDWRSWLKPEPVARTPLPPVQEALIISAWDMTQEAWNALTERERADKRLNFTKAPRFIS
jgi:hypothetical protein